MSALEDRCWQCPRCMRLRRGERPKTCFGCGYFGWWDWVRTVEMAASCVRLVYALSLPLATAAGAR